MILGNCSLRATNIRLEMSLSMLAQIQGLKSQSAVNRELLAEKQRALQHAVAARDHLRSQVAADVAERERQEDNARRLSGELAGLRQDIARYERERAVLRSTLSGLRGTHQEKLSDLEERQRAFSVATFDDAAKLQTLCSEFRAQCCDAPRRSRDQSVLLAVLEREQP